MTAQDIVRTNTYILDRDYVPVLAEMRKRFLGEDHRGAGHQLGRRRRAQSAEERAAGRLDTRHGPAEYSEGEVPAREQ